MCGKLNKSMYGTRDAAQNWEREYESAFLNLGFSQGKSSPCLFYLKERDIRVVVHGDDMTCLGDSNSLHWLAEELKKVYELKVRAILGPDPRDDKQVRILNRIVSWYESGIQYEPDQRVEIVIKALGLEKAKSVATPGTRDKLTPEGERTLEGATATLCMSMVMRLNYLAQDRPDIQFACKELARGMSSPTEGHWQQLKRLGRYLIHKPRMVANYDYQNPTSFLDSRVDTDHAGCLKTRKSTNGGALMHGSRCLKSWSTTQSIICLLYTSDAADE